MSAINGPLQVRIDLAYRGDANDEVRIEMPLGNGWTRIVTLTHEGIIIDDWAPHADEAHHSWYELHTEILPVPEDAIA